MFVRKLQVLLNMYNIIKSCIEHNNDIAWFFTCDKGQPPMRNVSPYLLSNFLADFEGFLPQNQIKSLEN